MNDKKILGFDLSTLAAIVLTGLVFFGWQTYLAKKYPQMGKKPEITEQTKIEDKSQANETATNATKTADKPEEKSAIVASADKINQSEELLKIDNSHFVSDLTSFGMGLKNVVLQEHKDRKHQPVKMGFEDQPNFVLNVFSSDDKLSFKVTKIDDNTFEGVAFFGETKITRRLEIESKTSAIKNTVLVENITPQFKGLSLDIHEHAVEGGAASFLVPSLEHQEFIVNSETKDERINNNAAKEPINKEFKQVALLGIGSQYFTSAVVDKSQIIPEAVIAGGKGEKQLSAKLIYKPILGQSTMNLSWIQYTGAKDFSRLESIDPLMTKAVDFGMFAAIAKILLMNLKWWHSVVGNWGLAIILLTLLVRVVVLPFNVATFRSTKKMQMLQPKVQALREKYKDDPQTMNKEMMGLWKQNKVNPLGGCLPMLLQLPVFFALYRVLGQSIELYQVPFFGWITDLSVKDPFYVLPVLMGVSMFIQQKITPSTMDPAQAKIMQFVPLLFAFMMISLPSGLTLYIFINTLSGIILQQAFMVDRKTISTKAVKA